MSARRARTDEPEFPPVDLPEYAKRLWEPARHYALFGGRAGTKSWTIARHLLIEAASKPLRIGCAREVQLTIKDSVKALLDDQIKLLGLEDYFESTNNEIRGRVVDSSIIFFGLWRNPEQRKSLEGLDKLWCEEANALSQKSIDVIIPTVRKSGSSIYWSWNPEFDHDPVDKLFRGPDGAPPRSILIPTGWEENPWLSAESRAEIDHLYEKNPRKARHIYGGEYVEEVEGAYYAEELAAARKSGRVCVLTPNRAFPLRAYWDLGRSDWTVVIICQFVGDRILVLDYCAGQLQPPSYYMSWLRDNEYDRAHCYLPHDGTHIHADNPISMSYEAQLKAAGWKTTTIRGEGSGAEGAARKRIDVTKEIFGNIWFQEDTTRPLIKALGAYHEERHAKTGTGLGPKHDFASHPADAFGLMGIDYKPPKGTGTKKPLYGNRGTVA